MAGCMDLQNPAAGDNYETADHLNEVKGVLPIPIFP